MSSKRPIRRPILAASFCIAAALLLYAPFVTIAVASQGMSCCAGGQCPIHGHHHPAALKHEMNCGHDMGMGSTDAASTNDMGEMTACTMSCCNPTDHPLLLPIAFVLPESTPGFAPASVKLDAATRTQIEPPFTVEPPSPPPRIAGPAL